MDDAAPRLTSPYQLTRLGFDSVDEYRAYRKDHESLFFKVWFMHETIGDQADPISLPGICDICDKTTRFASTTHARAEGAQFKHGVSWIAQAVCHCEVNLVERLILRALYDRYEPGHSVYHVGHFLSFRDWLAAHIPGLVSTQYESGRSPGEVENDVRYEDLTGMTFPTAQFDHLICSEILEHIPAYEVALAEMARVIKPGGRVILTFPWLGVDKYENRTRAKLNDDGSITHIEPAQYHGDSASGEGILSFRDFGWEVLDDCRKAGFSSARAEFVFAPAHGYMSLGEPVIVATR